MAIGYIKRLAGPYIGDGTGQKTFSFGFFVFTEGDVYVATAATENGASSNLQQGTDYTVTLNGDQEASPGGTITLTAEAGLADGAVLVIGSDVDYTQTLDLTNYTRFPPARISEELDRIVVQIQQLVEILGRTVKVDATDTMTPEELKQQLLEVAASAGTYRDEALAAAEAAAASESAAQTAQAAAELAQGKDLQDAESREFWLHAFTKGGGLGFLGDFIANGLSEDARYGAWSGLTNFAGPIVGTTIEGIDLVTATAGNALYDRETRPGARAVRLIRSHMPFVNLWYTGTAIDRAVMNDLQEYLSPGYNQRMESRMMRSWGQGYWWGPRDTTPRRSPRMADAPN